MTVSDSASGAVGSDAVPRRCDVVVIGGGPAGSMTAGYLARMGYSVTLFERERHPREKVGESILPHIWKYCDDIGVTPALEAEGFVAKAGGTVVWNSQIRLLSFKDFGYDRLALHVERDRFDKILLDHSRRCGAQVFERAPVTGIVKLEDGASRVRYRLLDHDREGEIECRFVVDASGQHSMIARELGLRQLDDGFRFIGMWGYFDDSLYVAMDGHAHPFEDRAAVAPSTTVVSVGERQGWTWHIPLRERTSVGLVIPIEEFTAKGKTPSERERFFLDKVRGLEILGQLLEPARYQEGSFRMARDYSYSCSRYAGEGFFLVGDAAAFVDPIFSLGVTFAMYSAFLASWSIDRALRKPSGIAQCRAVFDAKVKGPIALGRALALPMYQERGDVSAGVRAMMQLESDEEIALMKTVAVLTNRSQNFDAVAPRSVARERSRPLPAIQFKR